MNQACFSAALCQQSDSQVALPGPVDAVQYLLRLLCSELPAEDLDILEVRFQPRPQFSISEFVHMIRVLDSPQATICGVWRDKYQTSTGP